MQAYKIDRINPITDKCQKKNGKVRTVSLFS